MARFVLTSAVTVAFVNYASPGRKHKVGDVVELSAAEQTAITGAGGTIRATVYRDQLGEAFVVSNSN